jgi:hypothetical protein
MLQVSRENAQQRKWVCMLKNKQKHLKQQQLLIEGMQAMTRKLITAVATSFSVVHKTTPCLLHPERTWLRYDDKD